MPGVKGECAQNSGKIEGRVSIVRHGIFDNFDDRTCTNGKRRALPVCPKIVSMRPDGTRRPVTIFRRWGVDDSAIQEVVRT